VAGPYIAVDSTDPSNPVVTNAGVQTVVAGANITVDDTDPHNPIVTGTDGGGGVASLSGAGVTESPGDLVQAGGLTVNDTGDGIQLYAEGSLQLSLSGRGNINVIGTGLPSSKINIGTADGAGGGGYYLPESSDTVLFPFDINSGDTITYTPSGGSAEVFTPVPGTYNTPTDLINAINSAPGTDSDTFADVAYFEFITIGDAYYPQFSGEGGLGDTLQGTLVGILMSVTDTTVFTATATSDALSFFSSSDGIGQQPAITAPTGGSVVDTQARAAINSLITLLGATSGFGLTA
jgi:hypothetical protein